MAWLGTFMLWLVGIFIAVQLIAAWYSVIDLRYRLPGSRRMIMLRIAGWTLGVALLFWIVPETWRVLLLAGMIFMLVVHVLLIPLPNLLLRQFRVNRQREYQEFVDTLDASNRHL